MSDGPLPQCVNIRKAVTRCALYEGALEAEKLSQINDLVLGPAGLFVRVQFGTDEEDRQIVDLAISAQVEVVCQRCLNPMSLPIQSKSRLALVMTDEQAQSLPKDYEPWIGVEEVDLWAMAEEELALALPVVAYHDPGECRAPPNRAAQESPAGAGDTQNPFDVLSTLLGTEDRQES